MKAHAMEPHQGTGAGQAIEVSLRKFEKHLQRPFIILPRMLIFLRLCLANGAQPSILFLMP